MTPHPSPATTTARDVDAAAERLAGVVTTTPVERCTRLSDASGAEVWLKREDLQVVRSYKARGAYNLIAQLDDEQRAAGVVTASAGNHAQGVAFACAQLGVHGRVHLPRTTPRQKRDRIAAIGGPWIETVVGGQTYDDVSASAVREAEDGSVLVPAFDDPRTIAGQGTVVREAFDQLGFVPDVVVVPVGGGGVLAGAVAWLAARLVDGREPRLRFGRRFVVVDVHHHRVHGRRRAAGHHALEGVDIHRAAATTAATS